MHRKQLIERRPAYRRGQLLLENDFIDEQQFHTHARYRHNRHLHGFGVVHGLEVTRASDFAISVSPGFAVDAHGHEIELRDGVTLEISGLPLGAVARVVLGYGSESAATAEEPNSRIESYAHLRIITGAEPNDVRLATIELDERGKISEIGVAPDQRDLLLTRIAPGSVKAEALDPSLRCDWITMAFHPSDMPADEEDARPPFRVGATQAITHREIDGKPNTKGGRGSMAIVLPPGVRQILRFRVAGEVNEQKLTAVLVKGGFHEDDGKHLREEILTLEAKKSSYLVTGDVPAAHRIVDPKRLRTLSVDIRAQGYARISLIALEVSY